MASREFTDRNGVAWHVAEIHPQWAERRRRDRRAADTSGTASRVGERRRGMDRRRVAEVRAPVTPGYEGGWLTFESADEKRRLAPIPADWESLPPGRLELLCRAAHPVAKWRGRLVE